MFGKMMNSYYYGKSGKGDYRKEDLPKNRWQLFWEMLRIRFAGLIRLNLMYAVTWLPVIFVSLFSFMALYSGATQVENVVFAWLVILIPCILITGPFTAGISYVTRNWARDEHAFIWSDFKDAVKENWKQALGISAITSVMPFILYVCWTFYGQMSAQSYFFIVPQMLATVMSLVWFMSLIYMYPLMVSYKLKFKDLLRNGILLAIGRLPQSLGIRLLSWIPVAIAAVVAEYFQQPPWAMLGILLYYLLIGFGLSRFIAASYSNAVFDRFINSRIEGAPVNRGLSQEDDDEDDDEGEEE